MFARRLTTVTAVAAAALLALTACGGSSSPSGSATGDGGAAGGSDKNIIIGAPLATTGAVGSVGLEVKDGAELAIEQINAEGGINGRMLELRVQDTAGKPEQAVQVATSFAKDSDVLMLLGPLLTPEVAAAYPLTESNQIVMIPPASLGVIPGIEDGDFNEWTFRINQPGKPIFHSLIDEAVQRTDAKKMAVVFADDSPTYVEIGEAWAEIGAELGVEVQKVGFPGTTTDYSSIVTSIPKDTDLIALSALPANMASFIATLRQSGSEAGIVSETGVLGAEVWEGSRGGSLGAYSYSLFLPDGSDAAAQFEKDFEAKYDKKPTLFNALAYDAIKMVAASAGDGDVTRESIRDGLSGLTDFPGATGVINYEGSGDVLRADVPLVQIIEDGGFEKVGVIVPEKPKG